METYQSISMGYSEDLGVYMGLRFDDLSPNTPFYLEARGGYIYQKDPGNATEARKIFINDNSGGNIEKYGESYNLSMGIGYKWKESENFVIELQTSGLLNFYNANFAYIGDNEAFTVKTSSYGLGLGGGLVLPINRTESSFIVKSGVEYYFNSTIEAHGTYIYTPDGSDDNPRGDYNYEDAKSVINQPELIIFVHIGFIYKV